MNIVILNENDLLNKFNQASVFRNKYLVSDCFFFLLLLFPRHSIGKEVFESFSQRRKLFLNRVFTVKYGATSLGNQLQLTQKQTTKKELCIVPMIE